MPSVVMAENVHYVITMPVFWLQNELQYVCFNAHTERQNKVLHTLNIRIKLILRLLVLQKYFHVLTIIINTW